MTSSIATQRLRLNDTLHVADHSNSEVVNTQGESAMRLLTITFFALLPSTSQLCKQLELNLDLQTSFLILVLKVKTPLWRKFLAIKLLQLLHAVLINRAHPVEDRQTPPAQSFKK